MSIARQLTVGSLFAGIGGIELGLERTNGFKTVWQVESDPYAQKVLAKHWPDAGRWDDVRTFPPNPVEDWRCDIICGGFPCQDISEAGTKRGVVNGNRSSLWNEYRRVLGILRPRFAIVENSADLAIRGLHRVTGDLAEIGYSAEWQTLSARTFGAPHFRRRTFVVCYPDCSGFEVRLVFPKANQARTQPGDGSWWYSEPGICRVANGIPAQVDRLRCLGNAVVPQVAEWIGHRILEAIYG